MELIRTLKPPHHDKVGIHEEVIIFKAHLLLIIKFNNSLISLKLSIGTVLTWPTDTIRPHLLHNLKIRRHNIAYNYLIFADMIHAQIG